MKYLLIGTLILFLGRLIQKNGSLFSPIVETQKEVERLPSISMEVPFKSGESKRFNLNISHPGIINDPSEGFFLTLPSVSVDGGVLFMMSHPRTSFRMETAEFREGNVEIRLSKAPSVASVSSENRASPLDLSFLYPTIGRINIRHDGKWKHCTGFLTEENLVVTNYHCISKHEDCSKARFEAWDASGSSFRYNASTFSYPCNRIRYADAIFDMTVIETRGNPNARFGFLSGEKEVRFIRNDRLTVITNNKENEIIEKHCLFEDVLKSAFCDFRKEACEIAPPFYLLRDCDIIPGDSGSPVVNASGRLVGILFAGARGRLGVFTSIIKNGQ